jgi:hypothetical protein
MAAIDTSPFLQLHMVPITFRSVSLEILSRRLMSTHYCQTADWLSPLNCITLQYTGMISLFILVWEPPTLKQALANQSGPRQLRRPLGRAPLGTAYKDADLRHTSQSGRRGGTAVMVRKGIPHNHVDLLPLVSVETAGVCIPIGNSEVLLSCLEYCWHHWALKL